MLLENHYAEMAELLINTAQRTGSIFKKSPNITLKWNVFYKNQLTFVLKVLYWKMRVNRTKNKV